MEAAVMAMLGERLIFVGGAERSGTTLLQNILDSHPEICGGPEFRHIIDIMNLRLRLHESIKLGRINLFCSCEDVDNYIRTLIYSLLLPLLDKGHCKFLSEKTPSNIYAFTDLKGLFPASRFIRIVREPRAVICSEIEVRKKRKEKNISEPYDGSLTEFIKLARKKRGAYLSGASSSKIAPERELIVKYEDLVLDPEGETKKICSFLEIPWSKEMLFPSRKKHLGEGQMTRVGVHYTKESFQRDPEISSIDKWKSQLTRIQKAIIAAEFSDCKELARFGYNLNGDETFQKVLTRFIVKSRKIFKGSRIIGKISHRFI